MNVELKVAEDSKIIQNLFQYYMYDMSEYTGFSADDNGSYAVDESIVKLSDYWNLPGHYPYYIMVDGKIAGFSLIRKFPFDNNYFDVGQFYVMRKYKRKGVGKKAFELSVSSRPGNWVTRVLTNNIGAYKFWLNVIRKAAKREPRVSIEKYNTKDMYYFYYEV